MRKMRKVIVTLAIMAFVFGGSQALAGTVSCSLNGQKTNESSVLGHNYMSKYRCSASTQKRSANCIVVQVWGGSNKSCNILYSSMAVPNNVTAKTFTIDAPNYAKIKMLGGNAVSPIKRCYGTALLSNVN